MSQSKQRLLELNSRLAQNLTDKGVEATADETTTALINKVADIQGVKEEQKKVVDITENGTTEILPDENKALSKVTVNVDVEGDPILFNSVGTAYSKKLNISEGVTSIKDNCYNSCSELQEVVIPDSVTSIEQGAFYGCTKLGRLEIKNANIQLIEESAFYKTGLSTVDNLLKNFPEMIVNGTFREMPNLLEVEIPDNIKEIQRTAFLGCSSLTKVIIRGAKKVDNQAFDVCPALKTLHLPNTLTDAGGRYSFKGGSLEFVTLENGFNAKNLDLSHSTKYTRETIVSWLNALADRTGLETYTLIIGGTNLAKLTEEDIAIATNKNWTIA